MQVYENSRLLDYRSEPCGTLAKVNSPHGVRFTADGEFAIVADAGAPFLHVYARGGDRWAGSREPFSSYRVMDNATFLAGRNNPEEGGPKGVDIDPQGQVVVTTCESEALAFFSLDEVLRAPARRATCALPHRTLPVRERQAVQALLRGTRCAGDDRYTTRTGCRHDTGARGAARASDAFPERWRPALEAVDEIWVASEYVARILRRATRKPVIRIPHAFDVSLSRRYTRAEFSLPEQSFLFLFTFDFNSFVERKNPFATIEAFRRAFPGGDERAALVVKCAQGYRFPQQLELLRALAAKDPRIVVVDRLFTRDEMAGLQSVCDAFVSLHRAEGLGLCMAEGMAQGKPVIATGYSGNLDFMRADNSCLVGYTLIPVRPGDYVDYEPGWFWADPDVDQAARYMIRLVEDPEFGRGLGQRAAADMRKDTATARRARRSSSGSRSFRERRNQASRMRCTDSQPFAGAICWRAFSATACASSISL